MSTRHRIFLSFHHANDEAYKLRFEQLFCAAEKAVYSHSVNDGDIDSGLPAERIRQTIRDRYLRNSSVTVVLVGTDTWRRKHVDWEISSSLRHTDLSRRSGLIGLLLPSRWDHSPLYTRNLNTMPARLVDNVQRGYASLHPWTEDVNQMVNIIHNAWNRRFGLITPDHSRPLMSYNVRATDTGWV
jgi:hypothetical protein